MPSRPSLGRAECMIRRDVCTSHVCRFPCPVPSREQSAELSGNIVRRKSGICRLHRRSAGRCRNVSPWTIVFIPEFWKQLRWFALVEPETMLSQSARNLVSGQIPTQLWHGIFVSSKQPFWITGPDAIAAKLMTGKPLKILKAIKVIPHGVQPGLKPVKLYSQMKVDPLRDDLAVKLVELRSSVKTKNPKLAGGLKVAANSAAFGIFCSDECQVLDSPSPLHVFSGEADYLTPPDEVWEQPVGILLPRDRCHL